LEQEFGNKDQDIIEVVDERDLFAETKGIRTLSLKPIAARTPISQVGNRPITVETTTTLLEAIKKLVENNIGILPVTSKGILVAVSSEKDAIRALAKDADLNDEVIKHSTKEPKTHKKATIKDAIETMLSMNIRHTIAVDEMNRPTVVASVKDILKVT